MSYAQRRRFLWILFFMGLALAAAVARATTLAPLSFDDLAQKSVAIARPRCLSAESYWDRGEIWTETRFELVERHKGGLENTVTVRMLGGHVGNLHSRVDGVPAFATGEEVYLFLWAKPGESYRVLGWAQVAFRVARNPVNGEEKVRQDSAAEGFDVRRREFRKAGIGGMSVTAFQEKLRQALGRAKAVSP
jgi:hypothetical protein